MKTPVIWSYGGGVQSIAIAILIKNGLLQCPDKIVMADTSREASETWEYTNKYIKPILETIGIDLEIASHTLAKVDLYGKNGDLLIPAFTKVGKLPAFCSSEWKKRVIRRYLRMNGISRCNLWLGISIDESRRMKKSDVLWQEYEWPLINCLNKPFTRADCIDLVIRNNLPPPPKSSCWMCPNRSEGQWSRLYTDYPEDG